MESGWRPGEEFRRLSERFGHDEITDLYVAQKFLTELIDQTDGWVIVDFLDAANWDRLSKIEVDVDSSTMKLYWHDFRGDPAAGPMRMAFPADVYGAFLRFQSMAVVPSHLAPVFLLRGYALTGKEIGQQLRQDAAEYAEIGSRFFSRDVLIRRPDGTTEIFDCLSTPLFSLAILPKGCGTRASDSKRFLYRYNIRIAIARAMSLSEQVAATDDPDTICEKMNTLRRTLENLLKIECCYREVPTKKNYGQLLLGDLVKLLKPHLDDSAKKLMSRLAQWTNEPSHDSGKPVDGRKAEVVCGLVSYYGRILELEIG